MELKGSFGKGLVSEPKERVDRDKPVEWPERRNLCASGTDQFAYFGNLSCGWLLWRLGGGGRVGVDVVGLENAIDPRVDVKCMGGVDVEAFEQRG